MGLVDGGDLAQGPVGLGARRRGRREGQLRDMRRERDLDLCERPVVLGASSRGLSPRLDGPPVGGNGDFVRGSKGIDDLLSRNNLGTIRVKGHNSFFGSALPEYRPPARR